MCEVVYFVCLRAALGTKLIKENSLRAEPRKVMIVEVVGSVQCMCEVGGALRGSTTPFAPDW